MINSPIIGISGLKFGMDFNEKRIKRAPAKAGALKIEYLEILRFTG
jgi:hypothetical protein